MGHTDEEKEICIGLMLDLDMQLVFLMIGFSRRILKHFECRISMSFPL